MKDCTTGRGWIQERPRPTVRPSDRADRDAGRAHEELGKPGAEEEAGWDTWRGIGLKLFMIIFSENRVPDRAEPCS